VKGAGRGAELFGGPAIAGTLKALAGADQDISDPAPQGTDRTPVAVRIGDDAALGRLAQKIVTVAVSEIETDDRVTDVHDR
jgi:hypothetical protein